MTMVMVDLRTEAAAEVVRLTAARALTLEEDEPARSDEARFRGSLVQCRI